ncbi:uncharacterized protein LOC130806725 isoform X1 [Amaranthus tricolor]|uniref:uncharacterized protein LOC130806725 isoform X1 n=1 Tax=Amaranthus tricolor TaxID=29722 RepID=UPI0025891C9E|nr:uncharacterized protein LOC130806725 isoform X1 [Amaranthus tricolor]
MICESTCRSSEFAFNSDEFAGDFRKDSRISYSRESLMSLAEADFSKELPSGFDFSTLSELNDICNSAPEHPKLDGHEFTGSRRNSSPESAESWDICKLSSKDRLNDVCKTAPLHQRLLGHDLNGSILGDSSPESAEEPGSFNLILVDRLNYAGKSAPEHQQLPSHDSTDCGKSYSNKSQRSCQRPGNNGILGLGLLQNHPECDSILGSWSPSKQPSAGFEGSTLKLQGSDGCLLSRCNEPYRPPSFYKAMNHSIIQNMDSSSKEASGCGECPSKDRATGESWRKDTCLVLEEHLTVSSLTSKENLQLTSLAVSGCIELPCSGGKVSKNCLAEKSPVHSPQVQYPEVQQLLSKSQSINDNSGVVVVNIEELQGKKLEGGQSSALINLEETEDIDAYFPDEKNLAFSDNNSDCQTVKDVNKGFDILEKRELRSHAAYSVKSEETKIDDFQVNSMGKTANASAVGDSISSVSSVRPSCGASNSKLASVVQDWRGINAADKTYPKANDPPTLGPDQSEMRSKISDGSISGIRQSSRCSKKHDNVADGRGSCRSCTKFTTCVPDNADESDCDISSGVDEDGWIVLGASTGNSTKANHILGQGKPKEASINGQKASFGKQTKSGVLDCVDPHCAVQSNFCPDEISHHSQNGQKHNFYRSAGNQELQHAPEENSGLQIAEEANSSMEFNLPDEDSLITIDETYIFEQDNSKSSPKLSFSGGKNISIPESNNRRIPSLPHSWFHETQMNSKSLLVTPSNFLPRVSSTFNDPWKTHHNEYDHYFMVPPLSGWQSLKARNFKPSVKKLLSPRTPKADDYCPDLDNILSADPSTYHQFLQTPCSNLEPNVLRSLPLTHQNIVKSPVDVGKRALLAEGSKNSTVIGYLQMQRKFAQMNIDAVEQRAYRKAFGNHIW